jgi:nitrite reductase (NO-forming)
MLKVEGPEDKSIYSGTTQEGIYLPEGGTIQTMPKGKPVIKSTVALTLPQQIKAGKEIFGKTCFACHQSEGQGIPTVFPPLAKSDYLNADSKRAINAVLHGLSGEVIVNGKKFNSVMTSQNLTDEEIANTLTYIYNSWGNNKTVVTPAMVKAQRSKTDH